MTPRIVVLVSGGGSNLQALIDAALELEIVLVVSNRKAAFALERAATAGIPALYAPLKPFTDAGSSRAEYDADLAQKINALEPDLIVLAGWMHVFTSAFLEGVHVPVINLHPALPGQFAGAHAIEDAYSAWLEGKITESGCMVHVVIPELDAGEAIATRVVPFIAGDTLETYAQRLHAAEHELIVEATSIVLKDFKPSDISVENLPFLVDEKPFCLWGKDIVNTNLRFLKDMEPEYFSYLSEINIREIENSKFAALAIRNTYFHSIETLFALVFAGMQAPNAIFAWMNKYTNQDLYRLVEKINNGERIITRFDKSIDSWEKVLDFYLPNDLEEAKRIKSDYLSLWIKLAKIFTNETQKQEYNSIKHGFRIGSGGMSLGIDSKLKDMNLVLKNPYSSRFFKANQITDKINIEFKFFSVGWDPFGEARTIDLISHSMENIINFLIAVNSGSDSFQVAFPNDELGFSLPKKSRPQILTVSYGESLLSFGISPLTKEDVFASYSGSQS